jgi:hypothetical protein
LSGEAPFENDHRAGEFVVGPYKRQPLEPVENIANEIIVAYRPQVVKRVWVRRLRDARHQIAGDSKGSKLVRR